MTFEDAVKLTREVFDYYSRRLEVIALGTFGKANGDWGVNVYIDGNKERRKVLWCRNDLAAFNGDLVRLCVVDGNARCTSKAANVDPERLKLFNERIRLKNDLRPSSVKKPRRDAFLGVDRMKRREPSRPLIEEVEGREADDRSSLYCAYRTIANRSNRRSVTNLHVRELLMYVFATDRNGRGVQKSFAEISDLLEIGERTARDVVDRAEREFGLLVVIHQRHARGGQPLTAIRSIGQRFEK